MSINANKLKLDRLRSYSSIFSAPSFMGLIGNNDYGFIDAKIQRYDIHKVGKEIFNYHDYIRYAYRELKKQYRNEYIYKNEIINQLLLKKYGIKDTVLISEFRVGSSIADLAMFNGSSKVFEIKTELDSNKRLSGQINDYTKLFSECYIVTHESITAKYLSTHDEIGIIELVSRNRSLELREVRPPSINRFIDPETLIKSLRTGEYKSIVQKYFGTLPEMNSFNMFEICKGLFKQIPVSELKILFLDELKKRKSNTSLMPKIPKELRQICLTLNITEALCEKLDLKLKKTINL